MPGNAPQDDYVVSSFKLYAEIEGFGRVEDIVAISGTFAINTIPKASLTLACGINATTQQPATAHRMLANLKMRASVKVYLEIETTDGKKENSPSLKIMVFEGYYVGFGFQRAQDNAQYTMHLVHWLDDLNIGSMLSRNYYPGAPFSLEQSAVLTAAATGQGDSGVNPASSMIDPTKKYVNEANIEDNMWDLVMKPLLINISKWAGPNTCTDKDDNTSKPIQDALGKIKGKLPLQLKSKAADVTDAATAVNQGLSQLGFGGYHYNTFWGALLGLWAPNFLFAISPGVEEATLFPYFGGLRHSGDAKTITAEDYGYSNFMCNTGTILEGVNLYYAQQTASGVVPGGLRPLTEKAMCEPIGWYPHPDQRDIRGTVLIKEPPGWLNGCVAFTPHTLESVGEGSDRTGDNNNGMQHGNENRADGGPDRTGARAQLKNSGLADRFAEQWYKHEFLQQRYGELSGKLRFDIAPGSIVKIEAPRRSMPDLPDNTDLVAMVAQVSFVINAELANAGTAFSLTNIRSIDEDKEELKTADMPPLYNDKWLGGSLAKI